ncbi:MAG: threonylcarbamoyl-AMP synthase [Firmicutes bacterium]|nr:threonylcarbamoyl-AMP synthase [Bacillota bacterium]
MDTRVIRVDPVNPDERAIAEAARVIREGGLVAFPTETVYGLGADALNPDAVRKIFAAKGRPGDNPLIVHLAGVHELRRVASAFPPLLGALARRFWPGPLTAVIRRGPAVPDEVTAGLDTVAVRIPDHPVALSLIRRSGRPIAAPSANQSGRPSPTAAVHVWHDLNGKVDLILDGGAAGIGVESTVVDLTAHPPVLLRPGGITLEELQEVAGPVRVDPAAEGMPAAGPVRSPGMKYRHYAPAARCVLVEGPAEAVVSRLASLVRAEREAGRRVGVLATREGAPAYGAEKVCVAGSRRDPAEIARNLFRCLRELDEAGLDIIFLEGVEPVGLGLALANRMRRAAGYEVVTAGRGGSAAD